MKTYSIIVALVSVILMAITAESCSRDNSVEENATVQTTSENVIGISSTGYSKAEHWIANTQAVTWINNDNKVHSVTADDGSFDSGAIQPGGTFSKTFTGPGVYNYHDDYSSARASISVFGRENP